MADRSDLIHQLAASMGAERPAISKSQYESRFDHSTGTLYCDGMTISASVADQAIKYFTAEKSKCSLHDPASKQMAMIYQCAIEAIQVAQNPKVKAFLKDEIGRELSDR